MGLSVISYAGVVIVSPMQARARAHGTGRCGEKTRSGCGSVASQAERRRSPIVRRACGAALMRACTIPSGQPSLAEPCRAAAREDRPTETGKGVLTMTETTPASPAEAAGYEITRFNALRHGMLSRYTLLPWEDEDEYRTLLDALVAEHKPEGPTEEHLVEELAGILWRKRRLRLAEGAAYRHGLEKANSPSQQTVKTALVHLGVGQQTERVVDAIRATADTTTQELADLDEDQDMTARALDLLQAGKTGAYNKALGALREDTRERWERILPTQAELGLLEFIEEEVVPWYETRRKELQNRSLISAGGARAVRPRGRPGSPPARRVRSGHPSYGQH